MKEKGTAANIVTFPPPDLQAQTGGLSILHHFSETPWNMPRYEPVEESKMVLGTPLLLALMRRL